jgi:hypothetical protein
MAVIQFIDAVLVFIPTHFSRARGSSIQTGLPEGKSPDFWGHSLVCRDLCDLDRCRTSVNITLD